MVSFPLHSVTGTVIMVSFLLHCLIIVVVCLFILSFQTIGACVVEKRQDGITSVCDYLPQHRFFCFVSGVRIHSFCKYLQHGNYYSNMTDGYISGKH